MDAEVDSAWICTQAVVSTDRQSDNEQEKISNYGCIVLNDMIDDGRYVLKEGDNTIGRHPLNHIYIEHPSVSMNHAVIQCDSDGVVLLDKGSLNKTKLNKKTLRKDVAYFLEENALLVFGEVRAHYFMNERSNEFTNNSKSIAPDNTYVHNATQNDGLSLSKLSDAVITPKSVRTDTPNAIIDCNLSLVIENSSSLKIEKEVPKTITGTECAINILNDIHTKLNSSSPSDEYLLEALSQVEAKQIIVNSNDIFHNLSNEGTPVMNRTESMPEITLEDPPNPIMDLKSSILTTLNVTKNQFQSPNKIDTEVIREDTPSPVMDLKSSIITTNNVPKNIFQSPSKINTKLIREDTPSPIMDLGCYNDFENTLEINNHGIISAVQSPHKVNEFDNTQVLEIDNNIVELYTKTSNNDDILFFKAQKVKSGDQSNIQINNSSDIRGNDNLSESKNINLNQKCNVKPTNPFCRKNEIQNEDFNNDSFQNKSILNIFQSKTDTKFHNNDKNKKIVNTFEADDDDVFRNFIENESQQHDLAILENQDFFSCPTQKVSITKKIQPKPKVSSSIHKEETQIPSVLKKLNRTDTITSKIYSTDIHEENTQVPEMDDDFFNCPTQKLSITKNMQPKPNVSSIHKEETQILSVLKKLNRTDTITSKTSSTNIHEDLTEVVKIDEDFFNCPTQKVSIAKKIQPKPTVSSSLHEEKTQIPLELKNPNKIDTISSKDFSTSICEENTQIPEMDDDFFNCPTQKVSITKKIQPKPKVSSSIHEEETQIPLELKNPNKIDTISSKDFSTSIHEEDTQIPEMDDDFFNCPTQKVSITKKIQPKPKVSSSIHKEETQIPLKLKNPNKIDTISSKDFSTGICEENTQIPEMDDDFFNCPTQKVSITKKIQPKPKVSSSIHEEETQIPLELKNPNKIDTISSKDFSTSIHEEDTQIPEMDDDFFNCPTQKVSITKKIQPKPKVSSSIHKEETQIPLKLKNPNKIDTISSKVYSTSICEENTQIPEMDDDFFNCPTQKVSIAKKIQPKPTVSSSLHEEKTQIPLELKNPNRTDTLSSKDFSTSIHEENTQIPEMDDDFFNCPTQKVSITKKIQPKPKVSSSIHEEETQIPLELKNPNKIDTISSKDFSTSIHEEDTQIPEMDDDFFNCPTQKVSITKKIQPKPKVSSSIHEEETQIPLELKTPNKIDTISSKDFSTSIHEEDTQIPEMDDDFFNCPTQKVSITKKIQPKPKVSSSIHEEETQIPLELKNPNKIDTISSKDYSTSIYKENTQISEMDDDFFNCPTQKVSFTKKIQPKPEVSSTVHKEQTQEILEFHKPIKNIASLSKSSTIGKHEDSTQIPDIDDDFFNYPTQKINQLPYVFTTKHEENTQKPLELTQLNKTNFNISPTNSANKHKDLIGGIKIDDNDILNCPTEKLSCKSNSKISMGCKKHKSVPTIINEAKAQDSSIQSISKISLRSTIKQNKGNIFNCSTQKVQSNAISNCSLNINEDVTMNPEHFDRSNNHKQTVEPDNEDRCKVQKSKCIKSNSIRLSNVKLPVNCNEKSSNSLKINKPKIQVREDIHMSYSGDSSNNSTNILNKPNENSVINNINTKVPFNKHFDSPSCSNTATIKENDFNASSSTKQKHFVNDSVQSQVSVSLKYKHQMKQMDESIFSPLNIPDVSANSLLHHSSPKTSENSLNTLNCEPSTSSNDAFKWKSFWNKKKVQSQDKGKSDKHKSIKIATEVKENKERYQTRAITRKRKQNGVVESNKKICNRNKILEPLVENSSEIVVSFSYLKSRHLQEMKQFVDKTGGTVTDEITQCSVLVTDKIRCTMKILSAIARGCPIVNVNWLKHSYTVKMFQDVDDFIIVDKDAERKYKFQLKESLAKAKAKRLLDGYNVLVTPSVKPSPQEMKVIITCAGGNYVLNWTTTQYTKELIVTCDKDRTRWKSAWDNDLARIIDSDTLVMSIIRQKLTI